jgi:hypothetical protein
LSKEPRLKVGASSKEKARLNWGHLPPITWAIHPRAQLTCNSTRTCNSRRHYLAFSRNPVLFTHSCSYLLHIAFWMLSQKANLSLYPLSDVKSKGKNGPFDITLNRNEAHLLQPVSGRDRVYIMTPNIVRLWGHKHSGMSRNNRRLYRAYSSF